MDRLLKIIFSNKSFIEVVSIILISLSMNLFSNKIGEICNIKLLLSVSFFLLAGILGYLLSYKLNILEKAALREFDKAGGGDSVEERLLNKLISIKKEIYIKFFLIVLFIVFGGLCLFTNYYNFNFFLTQITIFIFIKSFFIIIASLSFLVIFNVVKFFHFAHGAMFMLGAYFLYLLMVILYVPFSVAIALSVIIVALLGVANNQYIYKPIRKIGGTPLILLIASLGVYTVLQNLVSLFFGDDTKSVRSGVVKEGLDVLGARITPVQIVIIISGIVLAVLTWALLKYTKIGKASRAVANNPALSEIYGINKEKIYNFVFAYGSALAAIAGILSALDTDMTPTMGFRPLMMGVIAMIIGGVGSIPGIVLGALLLGFAQNLAAWYLPSQWQDAIAFAIMLVFLLFRPQGFFGKPLRKAEV